MLTLKIEDLKDGLRSMMQLAQWKPQNLKLAYNIGRTWRDYKSRIEEAEEMEREIYKDFKAVEETTPQGIQLQLPKDMSLEDRKEFDARIKEFRAIDVEVWGGKLAFEDIEKALEKEPVRSNAPLSGDDISLLTWLIAEPIEAVSLPEPTTEKAQMQTA